MAEELHEEGIDATALLVQGSIVEAPPGDRCQIDLKSAWRGTPTPCRIHESGRSHPYLGAVDIVLYYSFDDLMEIIDPRRRLAPTILAVLTVFAIAGPAVAQTNEAPVWIRGAPIPMPNGIYVGPEGRLWIASVVGREIMVLDPESGEILDRFGPDRGVEGPDDLAFGPDGALYWTSLLTGVVGRRSPQGETSHQMVAPGVNPVTVSDEGRVFVALCFLGDALYELDPLGTKPPRTVAENVGDGCASNGMDFGPDGRLYGPRWFQGTVVRYEIDSGESMTVAEGFAVPAALKFDSRGRMHVLDTGRGEVVRLNLETGARDTVATLSPGLDNLAFDREDRLYVSSFVDGSILEVLEDGTTRTVSPGGLGAPGGIAALEGSIYVADVLSLKEFDAGTGEQLSVAPDIIGVSDLSAPFTVSAAGDRLVISSWFGNNVRVWDPASRVVVAHHDELAVPLNAVALGEDLVVAELGGARVVRIRGDDPVDREILAEGIAVPTGLASQGGDLWVADAVTGRLLQIVADGQALAEPLPVAEGLVGPEGMAVARDGRLLVVEAGAGRLTAIEPATGAAETIAEGLDLGAPGIEGMPPSWIFNGVTVDSSGAIYVTGDIARVVYRIRME